MTALLALLQILAIGCCALFGGLAGTDLAWGHYRSAARFLFLTVLAVAVSGLLGFVSVQSGFRWGLP